MTTIQDVASKLLEEKRNAAPSRFPCRAIMTKSVELYCRLLAELKKIGGVRTIRSDELFSSADVMPNYGNLCAANYFNEWTILTGVGEYLRLFSQKEANDRRFARLWNHCVPASSLGRIIVPLWGCEAQWFDPAIDLNGDPRKTDFYFDCADGEDDADDERPEEGRDLLVLSDEFERSFSSFRQEADVARVGLREWFEYWENPSADAKRFVLLTKRCGSVSSPPSIKGNVKGNMNIRVAPDALSFLKERMAGGDRLTAENCSPETASALLDRALKNESLDEAILKILNVSSFSGLDAMGKWNVLTDRRNVWADRRRFVKLWFQLHPDDGYLCRCFSKARSVDDIPRLVSHEIFKARVDRPAWVGEFQELARAMNLRPDRDYLDAVDAIPDFEERLEYLTTDDAEKEARVYLLKMVGEWLRKDAERVKRSEKLKKAFPALAAYLSCDLDALQNDVGAYISRYKEYKLKNALPDDEERYFNGVDASSFCSRYALLSKYEDDETLFLWVDALGVEWLSLLCWELAARCDGVVTSVELARATLPADTEFNKQWEKMTAPYKKLDGLDKLAHQGVADDPDYYVCVEAQMNVIRSVAERASSFLKEKRRVVITGDHGASRLAARFFHCREGAEVPPGGVARGRGRYCELPPNASTTSLDRIEIVCDPNGKRYAAFKNYDHFKRSGFAAGAWDDDPVYGEVHGGATPEEILVPVVAVERRRGVRLVASWKESAVKISKKKARASIALNRPTASLRVKIVGGPQGETSKVGNGEIWNVVFSNAKAGVYSAEVSADGRVVNLPKITFRAALGDGDGDLPW